MRATDQPHHAAAATALLVPGFIDNFNCPGAINAGSNIVFNGITVSGATSPRKPPGTFSCPDRRDAGWRDRWHEWYRRRFPAGTTLQLAVFDAEFLSQFGFALLQSQALQIGALESCFSQSSKRVSFNKGQAEVKLLAGSKEREGLLERRPFLFDFIGAGLDGHQFGMTAQPEAPPRGWLPLPQRSKSAKLCGWRVDASMLNTGRPEYFTN